jgi:hypothetical protein
MPIVRIPLAPTKHGRGTAVLENHQLSSETNTTPTPRMAMELTVATVVGLVAAVAAAAVEHRVAAAVAAAALAAVAVAASAIANKAAGVRS